MYIYNHERPRAENAKYNLKKFLVKLLVKEIFLYATMHVFGCKGVNWFMIHFNMCILNVI